MAVSKQRQAEARAALREILEPGDTVHTVLKHVSRSGMTRAIDAYRIHDGDAQWISRRAADATDTAFSERYEAVSMGGCGMDMGFALVYALSWALFPEYECTGEGCPSADHVNPPRPDAVKGSMTHRDGYALKHRWM